MQEHQQDVYDSIHTGNTQYFVPIHIYIEHTQVCPVYVAIHAGHAQGVLHVCPYSYRCVMSLYSCTKGRPCYVCIKHDCAYTAEIICDV